MLFIKNSSGVVSDEETTLTSIVTSHLQNDPSLSQLLAHTDYTDQPGRAFTKLKVNSWGFMERAETDHRFFSEVLEWALCGIIPGMRTAISEYEFLRVWLVEHVYGPGVIHTSFVESRLVDRLALIFNS
jgi:hypothetical protein